MVINSTGVAFIDGRATSDVALEAHLKALAVANPQSLVIIQADKTTMHGRVVSVMDMAQTAGLRRLAIATNSKSETAAPAEPAPAPGPSPPAAGATAP